MAIRSLPIHVADGDSIKQPYLIAEVGVNHEGRLENARRMIDDAAEGGADAVKFQSYKAETLASKNSPAYWDTEKEPTQSQFELFKKHDSFWKSEFDALKNHCDSRGIEFISTPFDTESAVFLNDLMPYFKISSSDLTNKPFIKFICNFNKPILLSCGASHLWEIQRCVEWIEESGNELALLHCVLNYPTADEDANLGMISSLKRKFPERAVGYSDHTLPREMRTLETATLLGAVIIEKHFTFDKTLPGNDHYHSMDKADLIVFRKSMDNLLRLIGSACKPILDHQQLARENARRSLVVNRSIRSGEIITADHITAKRPAHGICPSAIDNVLNRKAAYDVEKDTVLDWEHIGAAEQ